MGVTALLSGSESERLIGRRLAPPDDPGEPRETAPTPPSQRTRKSGRASGACARRRGVRRVGKSQGAVVAGSQPASRALQLQNKKLEKSAKKWRDPRSRTLLSLA